MSHGANVLAGMSQQRSTGREAAAIQEQMNPRGVRSGVRSEAASPVRMARKTGKSRELPERIRQHVGLLNCPATA